MAAAVFIDLTAAYDTVLALRPNMQAFASSAGQAYGLADHGTCTKSEFTLTTGTGLQSRLRRPKNGVPQGSVLAFLLFNIYIHDLPVTIARKFAYAGDLAIMHATSNCKTLEETLSQDMATISL